MKFLLLSNFQVALIVIFNWFLRLSLAGLAGFYIAQTWNSIGAAVIILLTYLVTEAYINYMSDQQDVIYVKVMGQEGEDDEE